MTVMHLLYKRDFSIGTYPQTTPVTPLTAANLLRPFRTSLKNDPLTLLCGEVLNLADVRYRQIIACEVKGV